MEPVPKNVIVRVLVTIVRIEGESMKIATGAFTFARWYFFQAAFPGTHSR
jgi:hypothetical protein